MRRSKAPLLHETPSAVAKDLISERSSQKREKIVYIYDRLYRVVRLDYKAGRRLNRAFSAMI